MFFANQIIEWYGKNKRELPWRDTCDPYLIWLSEIILQQTRVKQGLEYYLRFTKAFPTIQQLADASEDEVMKLWQGLGYYTRARNLHETAKLITGNFKGEFPEEYSELCKLKGIGKYTAAAISSFAFNKPYPVLDGNVYRVLSRYFGITTPIDTSKGEKEFYRLANSLLDKKKPALFNQAIMEFGAMHCKPQNPLCNQCCLNTKCVAFSNQMVERFPVKSKKVKQRDRFFNYLIIKHDCQIFLCKRENNDIWKGLYEFPLIETGKQIRKQKLLRSDEWGAFFHNTSYTVNSVSEIIKHQLTHQNIYARFWEIRIDNEINTQKTNNFFLVPENRLLDFAFPRLIEKYLTH